VKSERVVSMLAKWSRLPPLPRPSELIAHWDWTKLPRDRVVLTPQRLAELD